MKKITIKNCKQCPHHRTQGFLATIPKCKLSNKDLPHEFKDHAFAVRFAVPIVKSTGEIPEWCKLDNENVNTDFTHI